MTSDSRAVSTTSFEITVILLCVAPDTEDPLHLG